MSILWDRILPIEVMCREIQKGKTAMENRFFTRIAEGQGTIEDVARKLPGFKGYLAKQDRRAADRLLREHIVLVFEELLREFTRLQNQMVDSGGLKYMERARRIDTVLQTFIDRVRTAPEGYAGR